MILNKFYEKIDAVDISQDTITTNNWFIGSSLQAVDLEKISNGIYKYKQDTIWERILKVDNLNPYLNVHNRTINFLAVNDTKNIKGVLNKLLSYISDFTDVDLMNVYVITDEYDNFLNSKIVQVTDFKIPFFIGNQQLGYYNKFFIKTKKSFRPLFDVTTFKYNEKDFFEINVNLAYIEVVLEEKDGIFLTSYYDKYSKYLPYKRTNSKSCIKWTSLIESVNYIEKYNIAIGSKFSEQSVKNLLKSLAFNSCLLHIESETLKLIHIDSYRVFVEKECFRIKNFDKKTFEKFSEKVLLERFGITKDIFLLYKNEYDDLLNYSNLRYYTDIPYCSNISSEDMFINAIKYIYDKKDGKKFYDSVTK